MKLSDIKNIEPVLTVKEHEVLTKAEHLHEDPHVYTHPKLQSRIRRLIMLGLIRKQQGADIYERTEKGEALLSKQ